VAHLAIASVVVWGGAGLIEQQRAWGAEGPPAITWVPLPKIDSPQAETLATPIPTVTVPTVAPPPLEPLKLDEPPVIAIALSVSIRASLPAPMADPLPVSLPGLPGPVNVEEGVSGDPGRGPSCGAVTQVRASAGPDAAPESGESARDTFGPTGEPPDDQREHTVQFWIRSDGRVTKIAVTPPISDANYRRRFRKAVSTFVFGPVKTPDGRPISYVYSCVVYP
jgi:hypothetical protein